MTRAAEEILGPFGGIPRPPNQDSGGRKPATLTLRDQIAVGVFGTAVAEANDLLRDVPAKLVDPLRYAARRAYQMADAMMSARNVRP